MTQELIKLGPGDLALGTRGDRLETLLGSCVSIILTDPRRTVGVMCHFVHSRPVPSDAPLRTAYADGAWREMQRLLLLQGITPRLCEAYVYGGGDMFPGEGMARRVGEDNIRWALGALDAAGVRILASDLDGSVYRKVSWEVGPQAPRLTAETVQLMA